MSAFYVSFGTLEGQGRPGVAAIAFVVGCWLVCLPMAYVLAFTFNLGLYGIWYAMVAGYVIVTLVAVIAVLRGSWELAMAAALKRSQASTVTKPLPIDDDTPTSQEAWTLANAAPETTPLLHKSVN